MFLIVRWPKLLTTGEFQNPGYPGWSIHLIYAIMAIDYYLVVVYIYLFRKQGKGNPLIGNIFHNSYFIVIKISNKIRKIRSI
ncbi:MAG TPA: hypothetical protein DCL77_07660 [Prolixibacteraceae bacterium]|nr:hypothetical protein [Prolixibacteraceae bacterium]